MLAASGIGLAAGVLVINVAAGVIECGGENSFCARAGPPRLLRGRVYASDGAPATAATLLFYFDSIQPRRRQSVREYAVRADAQGRFCLSWPVERSTAGIRAVHVLGGSAPDPRLESLATHFMRPIIVAPDSAPGVLQGGSRDVVLAKPWDPSQDATPNCHIGSPPWYRIDDLTSNWRYQLLLWLPLTAAVLSGAGLFTSARFASRLSIGGNALGWSALALFALIWILKIL